MVEAAGSRLQRLSRTMVSETMVSETMVSKTMVSKTMVLMMEMWGTIYTVIFCIAFLCLFNDNRGLGISCLV